MAASTRPGRPFGTILTAMVTPFHANGALDVNAAAALAEDLVALGNDGLVLNGTTGESATTTEDEKNRLLAAVVEAVGDRATIVAGVGSNDTAHSIGLAQDAERLGADGVLVVTPYYNKPPQAGLLAHFTAVADATGLPMMVYDIPGRAGVPIMTETLLRLAEHPRILANKDAKGDPFAAQQVMNQCDLVYYSGDDTLNLPLIAVGAVGVVSVTGHVVADRHRAMLAAYEAGDVVEARRINNDTVPVTTGIMTRTQGVIAVKAALEMQGRPGGGALRLPLVPLDAPGRDQLRSDLARGGIRL